MSRKSYSSRYESGYGRWAPYVPVAQRRRGAAVEVAALRKKGQTITPVHIDGRKIATTFWGMSWCDNLEAYSDYANRLPRGRTYVRNGSVVDLQIAPGKVTSLVSGSSLYKVAITIKPVDKKAWAATVSECSGKLDSLVELLQGKMSKAVMEVITRQKTGLFPTPSQISLKCSCPDSATMCKHVAATLYGVGARLDDAPNLLFVLREVDHMDLIAHAGAKGAMKLPKARGAKPLERSNLADVFGIELDEGAPLARAENAVAVKVSKASKDQTVKKSASRAQSKAVKGAKGAKGAKGTATRKG